MIWIMANYKRFVSPENQLVLEKNCEKKYQRDRFLMKSIVPRGAMKFLWSPITRILRVVARNGFRCFIPLPKLFQVI